MRCSAPSTGRLVPAAAIASPLSSRPFAMTSRLDSDPRSGRSRAGRAAASEIIAGKAS
jgi:hypothetical protein